jgi:hypothetical protein
VPYTSSAIFYDLFISSDYATGTVTLDPESEGMSYLSGTVVTITITPDPDGSYTRYIYDGVEGTGTGSYTGDETTFQVTMNSDIDEYILWQLQYTVSFETSGISGETGSDIALTVDGVEMTADDLPFVDWYDDGAEIVFSYSPTVAGIGGVSYVYAGEFVYYYDASGNLHTAQLDATYTVWTPATITGFYTVTTTTTTTATTASTTTTTSTEGFGYYGTATTTGSATTSTSGGWSPTGIAEGWESFWGSVTDWFSSLSSPSSPQDGGAVWVWLQESTYGIPHWAIPIGLIILLLIVVARRREKKKRKRRHKL